MDWSNQRYVRVFVEDSRDYIAFGWQGRALFVELLRKSDRAGIIDFDDGDMPVLADMVRMPVEIVAEFLPRLIKRGSVVERDGHLIIPNKMEACESSATPAQRSREYRAKQREVRRADALGLTDDAQCDDTVTKRDDTVTPRNNDVTARHPEAKADPEAKTKAEAEDTPAPIGTDTEEPVMQWSDKLTRELKRLKVTRAYLAQCVIGATRETVKGWLSGSVHPSPDELLQIDRALGLFRKQHEAKKSAAKRYQDDVCTAFEEMFLAKFEHRPTWTAGHFAAIKRWREAGHSTQLVIDKARIMLSWHGSKWPCGDSCDFGTLVKHFDKFSEVKAQPEAPRPMTRAAKARKAEAEANR